METKIIMRFFKTGVSIMLSIPKEILVALGMKAGGGVNLELDHEQRRVIILPVDKFIMSAEVNEEFARQVDVFMEQYRPALNELARL